MHFPRMKDFARIATLMSLILIAAALTGAAPVQATPMTGLNLPASLLRDLRSVQTETPQAEKAYYHRRYYRRNYYGRRYYRPYYYRPRYYHRRYYRPYYYRPWRPYFW